MDPEAMDSVHLFKRNEFEDSPNKIHDILQFRAFAEQLNTHTHPSVLEIEQITEILDRIKAKMPQSAMPIQQDDTFIQTDGADSSIDIPEVRMEILNESEARKKLIRRNLTMRLKQKSSRFGAQYNLRKNSREPDRLQKLRRSSELHEQAKLKARQKWLECGKTRRFSSLRQNNAKLKKIK